LPVEKSSGTLGDTVANTLLALWRQPFTRLVLRWHWKAALLSACVRGALFFTVTLSAGVPAALAAMRLEALIYAVLAGFYGALVQSFRRVKPAWAATLTVMCLLPLINHSIEFAIHAFSRTPRLGKGMLVSIGFSFISACFNLFAMRRGVFIVGDERRSLLSDLLQMPRVVWQFVRAVPLALQRFCKFSLSRYSKSA
jgi:hypothetical protein